MEKITFTTSTGANTLEYTKLLLRSLKENLSTDQHEIIVFVDGDNDGTADYLRSIKKDFYDMKIITHKIKPAVGLQRNAGILVEYAKNDIVAYLHSDMVVSKNYDAEILKDLEDNCVLSSTRIEPPLHGDSPYTFTKNLGMNPKEFDWAGFLNYAESVKSEKILDYFFAPYAFHKETWNKIGGYDTIHRRAREDSDFVQRCVQLGVKLKQTFRANVYHFTCVSSRGKNWFDRNNQEAKHRAELQKIADAVEMRRFIRKWGGFNHGEYKLNKLDTDLVVKNYSKQALDFIVQLEPFFSRVWLLDETDRDYVLSRVSLEQDPANKLLGFSEPDWQIAAKFFNTVNYEQIYLVGEPEDYNIKVELDLSKNPDQFDPFLQNITSLSHIIEPNDPGIYELGCAKILVNKIINTTEGNIQVKNPPFDYNLLTIE